jgi:hypothetical protein
MGHRDLARGDLSGATDCLEDLQQAAEASGDEYLTHLLALAKARVISRALA